MAGKSLDTESGAAFQIRILKNGWNWYHIEKIRRDEYNHRTARKKRLWIEPNIDGGPL